MFPTKLKEQGLKEYPSITYVYQRMHELLCTMNADQLGLMMHYHPEAIKMAEYYGEVEEKRIDFNH